MTEIVGVRRAFGRHVEHDERSKAFGVVVNPNVTPKTVMWDSSAPVLDQGEVGGCTGWATAQCINVQRSQRQGVDARRWLTDADALTIYEIATRLDDIPGHYPPEDTGSSGLAACKAATRRGYLSGYRHAFGLDQLLAALQMRPVIVGTVWLSGMNEPGAGALLDVSGDEEGGHEYCVVGCDVEREQVTILNSWSDQWGDRGRAHIVFADMDALLRAQGDVTVPVAA